MTIRILVLMFFAIAFSSCEKEVESPTVYANKIDPNITGGGGDKTACPPFLVDFDAITLFEKDYPCGKQTGRPDNADDGTICWVGDIAAATYQIYEETDDGPVFWGEISAEVQVDASGDTESVYFLESDLPDSNDGLQFRFRLYITWELPISGNSCGADYRDLSFTYDTSAGSIITNPNNAPFIQGPVLPFDPIDG